MDAAGGSFLCVYVCVCVLSTGVEMMMCPDVWSSLVSCNSLMDGG